MSKEEIDQVEDTKGQSRIAAHQHTDVVDAFLREHANQPAITPEEEAALVRKIDWRMLPIVSGFSNIRCVSLLCCNKLIKSLWAVLLFLGYLKYVDFLTLVP